MSFTLKIKDMTFLKRKHNNYIVKACYYCSTNFKNNFQSVSFITSQLNVVSSKKSNIFTTYIQNDI